MSTSARDRGTGPDPFFFFLNPDLLLKVTKPLCSLKTALNANQSSELIGIMKNYKRYPFS